MARISENKNNGGGGILSFSKAALWVSVSCAALLCSTAAQAQPRPFDIPAQDAGRSIPELARQAGIQIIAPGQALHGLVTPAIRGQLAVRDALTQMLRGSNLSIASDDGHTIVLVVQAPAPDSGAPAERIDTVEQVVVTGSRVISDPSRSPTPIMVFGTRQLQSTTPSNLPDALNKLPVFQGSLQPRTAGNGGSGSGMNVLALRNFGAQRTLVLFDGHRVAPSNSNGTVDIDTLPQMLIQRVEVVTGGGSAVYGSDAVTGVVNFVLDRNFTGLQLDFNSGLSNYGDGFSYKAAVAAGASLLGGRAHVEFSLEHFNQDGVPILARPYGPQYWSLTGSGTAASPYVNVSNTRVPTHSFGGIITCAAPCTLNGQQFVADGVVVPFVHGTPTGTANVESGGDGAYNPFGQAITYFRTSSAFGRFSYDLDDATTAYLQLSGSEAFAGGTWYPTLLNPGAYDTNRFFTSNVFLPASVQQALNPGNLPDQTFRLTKYLTQFGRQEAPGTRNLTAISASRAAWKEASPAERLEPVFQPWRGPPDHFQRPQSQQPALLRGAGCGCGAGRQPRLLCLHHPVRQPLSGLRAAQSLRTHCDFAGGIRLYQQHHPLRHDQRHG